MPLTLAAHLRAQSRGAVLYFDASAPYKLEAEAELYGALLKTDLCVEVPKGVPADREMLKQATRQGACVLSRDQFRDHRKRYRRLIDDPARRFNGSVANGRILIPNLGLDIALPTSAAQAWALLNGPAGP